MVKQIPDWLQGTLQLSEAEAIETAVTAAESRSSGELVPVLIRASTVNVSAPVLGALIAGFLGLSVKHLFLLMAWPGHDAVWLWPVFLLLLLVTGFGLGGTRSGQVWLTPRWERRRQVQQRAMIEFYQAGLNRTRDGTGLLLFVSLLEHEAVVLADEGIASHCPQDRFDGVMKALVDGAKQKKLGDGYRHAVELCGDILARHLPKHADDTDELKNHLRLLEG